MNNFIYDSLLNIYQNNKDNIEYIKNQYLHLLSFLTDSPDISTTEFIDKILEISKIGDIIICYCINIENNNQHLTILGSGTIIYEPKIIHKCKYVGHIEDIVVHSSYTSNGIAKNILQKLVNLAITKNCYKVILGCDPELKLFYEKMGFALKGNQMSKYFY